MLQFATNLAIGIMPYFRLVMFTTLDFIKQRIICISLSIEEFVCAITF